VNKAVLAAISAIAVGSILVLALDRAPEPAAYPPGTVLAVAGEPISAAEVAETERRVRLLYPSRSPEYATAAALESFVLPRAAVRAAYASERARAAAEAAAAWARIEAGRATEPEPEEHCGTADDLSLFLWAAARELEPGAWSGPLERIGSFSIVQLVSRDGFDLRETQERICIRALDFGYLPPAFGPEDLDAALRSAKLEIVDPGYEGLVPEHLRYLMKGTATP
jgi:hypothetical protein